MVNCSAQPTANINGAASSDREEWVQPERAHQNEDQIGGKHDQVAMGEIDQPHDAEDEAQARREQRIEPAEQHALHDGIKPLMARGSEIGIVDGVAATVRPARPGRRDAPLHHAIDAVGDLQRLADILLDDDERCAGTP